MTPQPPVSRSLAPSAPALASPPSPAAPDVLWPLFLQVLRTRGHITFMIADLGDCCGWVDKHGSAIVLDESNDQNAMRSTVAHELQHLDCPECPEEEIEQMTAQLLVPLADALAAAQLQAGARVVADRLGVDQQLVHARIRSISQEAANGVG